MSTTTPANATNPTGATGQGIGSSGPPNSESDTGPNPLPFFPAGLQLLYDYEGSKIRSINHAFFLAVHWSFMRGGFRRTTTRLTLPGSYEQASTVLSTGGQLPESQTAPGSQGPRPPPSTPAEVLAALTETPDPDWVEKFDNAGDNPVIFHYMNPLALEEGYYKVDFFALNNVDMIVRITNRYAPAARKQYLSKAPEDRAGGGGQVHPKGTQAANFIMTDFVRHGPSNNTAFDVFYKAAALEKHVFKYLFEDLGLPVYGVVPCSIGIYDDQVPAAAPQENRARDYREDYGYQYDDRQNPYQPHYPRRPVPNPGGFGGPLYAPPVGGGGGLGRSDLDPLGGIGAGMLADPRGFRRPGPPTFPGIAGPPPGARFDPFGPVPPPGRGPFGPGPPGRNPGQFGGPTPDHEQPPPGFEDMFM